MKNTSKVKKSKTISEIDFKDHMADLDARLLILAHLFICFDQQYSLEGEVVSEIGGILFKYLEDKKLLENRFYSSF